MVNNDSNTSLMCLQTFLVLCLVLSKTLDVAATRRAARGSFIFHRCSSHVDTLTQRSVWRCCGRFRLWFSLLSRPQVCSLRAEDFHFSLRLKAGSAGEFLSTLCGVFHGDAGALLFLNFTRVTWGQLWPNELIEILIMQCLDELFSPWCLRLDDGNRFFVLLSKRDSFCRFGGQWIGPFGWSLWRTCGGVVQSSALSDFSLFTEHVNFGVMCFLFHDGSALWWWRSVCLFPACQHRIDEMF